MPATHRGGEGSAPRVPLLKRAAILALHWHGGMLFKEIGQRLGVKERTASDIIHRAKERAMDPKDFDDVLSCLEDEHGGGQKPKIPKGSEASLALRNRCQLDEKHWQMPFPDIAKEVGIEVARSTLERVFHDHYNIFRRKPTHKPSLTTEHMEARLAFAHMALHIAIHTIVFTDEMWVEFNSVRRQQNVSQIVGPGIDAHQWAIVTADYGANRKTLKNTQRHNAD